ncbi:MAG: cold-shock protein, partial [Ktedonobacteraceae bacterium]
MSKRRGMIIKFHETRRFGFIQCDDGGPDVFFFHDAIVEDVVGRRQVSIGEPVEFETTVGEDGKIRAANVKSLWIDPDEVIDADSYREESVISRWLGNTGLARRPDGGTVLVSIAQVLTEGELQVGTHIWHGVKPPDLDQEFWEAIEIEVIMPQAVTIEPKAIETGTVYFYDLAKGYGFLAPGGRNGQRTDRDVFFHGSRAHGLDEHNLVGQNVQFRVNADIPGREWAYDITPLIDDTPISESWPPKDTKPIERV